MNKIAEIKKKIIEDDTLALKFQYVMKKTLETGIQPTLSFIYRNYKIKKSNNGFFNIYELGTKDKVYDKLYLQETAKYIIRNINSYSKIRNIIELEQKIFRYRDKIRFMNYQIERMNKDYLLPKKDLICNQYYQCKVDYFRLIEKHTAS